MKARHVLLGIALGFLVIFVTMMFVRNSPTYPAGKFPRRTQAENDSISKLPIEVPAATAADSAADAAVARTNGADSGSLFAGLSLFVLAAIAYLFPAIVASWRKHHQSAPIALLNLLLGWTVLGWIVALIWAASNTTSKATTVTVVAGPSGDAVACMKCGKINGPWKFCTQCGALLVGSS